MRIAFCAYGVSETTLQRTEFYRQDFEILRSLGHEVTFLSRPMSLRKGFDLAFVWWWNYLWAWGPVAAFSKIPVMTTGVFDVGAFHRMPFPKRKLKEWGVRWSDFNIVVSREEEEQLPGLLGNCTRPICYSPLAIDSRVYRPAEVPRSQDGPVMIANIAWQRIPNMRRKMVPELLEAFSQLAAERKDCRLVLAGPPEDGGAVLQARARELGIDSRVEFPGEISREEKVRLLQRCDLYCQVSRYEGFGVAIGEAMACGAPVLVARVGAVPEVVGDCGLYVKELSVQGILDGLRAGLADREASRRRAEQGTARVRELFSVERRTEDLKGFIRDLV